MSDSTEFSCWTASYHPRSVLQRLPVGFRLYRILWKVVASPLRTVYFWPFYYHFENKLWCTLYTHGVRLTICQRKSEQLSDLFLKPASTWLHLNSLFLMIIICSACLFLLEPRSFLLRSSSANCYTISTNYQQQVQGICFKKWHLFLLPRTSIYEEDKHHDALITYRDMA